MLAKKGLKDSLTYDRRSLSQLELASTLAQIDAKLDRLVENLPRTSIAEAPSHQSYGSPFTASRQRMELGLSPVQHDSHFYRPPTLPTPSQIPSHDPNPVQFEYELAMPLKHSTAPQNLLFWPCSPVRLAEAERRYALDAEINRSMPKRINTIPRSVSSPSNRSDWINSLSLSQVRTLTSLYFSYFHPQTLIIDKASFYTNQLPHVLENGFERQIDSCVVLLVLALGAIAACETGSLDWTAVDSESPSLEAGYAFFAIAQDFFNDVREPRWTTVQVLLLTRLVSNDGYQELFWLTQTAFSMALSSEFTINGLPFIKPPLLYKFLSRCK